MYRVSILVRILLQDKINAQVSSNRRNCKGNLHASLYCSGSNSNNKKCLIELMTLTWYVRRRYTECHQTSNWFSIQTTLIECVRKCLLERLGSNHIWSITTQKPAVRRLGISRHAPDVEKCNSFSCVSVIVMIYYDRFSRRYILHEG